MKVTWVMLIAGIVLFMGTTPARAHHSFAAEYDANQPIELKGLVTKVEWTNPHARFYIDVKNDRGDVSNWNFELSSPSILTATGGNPTRSRSATRSRSPDTSRDLSPRRGRRWRWQAA